MASIVCPSCGEDDKLSGERKDDVITITCEVCGMRWKRDLRPKCGNCGSENLSFRPQPLWSGGRGTMRAVSGLKDSWDCDDCGASDATRKGGDS